MKIQNVRVIRGPNLYHRRPVLVMRLDLEALADVSSEQIPGFNERIEALLPGLVEHRCSPGRRGGFLERLERGTYFGHIIEHIALELSGPAGIEVGFGKTIYGGSHGVYDVIVRYTDAEAMEFLLREAVEIAQNSRTELRSS